MRCARKFWVGALASVFALALFSAEVTRPPERGTDPLEPTPPQAGARDNPQGYVPRFAASPRPTKKLKAAVQRPTAPSPPPTPAAPEPKTT